MKRMFVILFALLCCCCNTEEQQSQITTDSLCIVGASFTYPENCWFELACEKMGLKPINKAISGSNIKDTAQSMRENSLFTLDELDSFATFAIMHTHNYNVYDGVGVHTPYVEAYDYVIKQYSALCQALEFNTDSKWFGIAGGKPVDILICTHWHDARTNFNESVRKLDEKWESVRLCKFDEQIGFTKDKPDPQTGVQISVYYAHPDQNATEIMGGIEYGWHPKRGRDSEIQQRMADIFCKCF
jgi:hypothetical protein